MKKFLCLYLCLGLTLNFLTSFAFAQEFGGSVSIASGESDNADKSSNGEPQSERQDIYRISLSGEYDNPFLSATAQYSAENQRFSKGSQEDRTFVDGRSSVFIGTETSFADVSLKHSRRTLLSSPDEINISTNQDNREIFSVIPRVKKRFLDANLITATADFTYIKFDKNALNDSERVTAAASWLRDISKVSTASIEVDQTEVSFKNFDFANYRYNSALFVYSTQLRKLSYGLAAGYNQSERDIGGTYDSPMYTINVLYKAALHQFQFNASQQITDSSMGGGNNATVNMNPTSDGAFKVDQIERLNAELSWTTQIICARCTSSVSVYANDDDYLVLPEAGQQKGAALSFNYALTSSSNISYRLSSMEQTFEGELAGQDYNYVTQVLSYSMNVSKNLNFRLFYEREERESQASAGSNSVSTLRGYDENFIGGAISYSF